MKTIPLCLALACMACPAAAAEPKAEVVTFSAGVLVEVDAAGKPVKVEASQDLPEQIRQFVERRVASWQYQPASIDGVPQSATTYVAVNACAVPVPGGYRLGVDFNGNGPRTARDRRLVPPMYPRLAARSGTEAEFVLILGVEADGRAVIDQVERADISGRAGASEFEPVLRAWARTVRFEPERVAGKAVRGQVRIPVGFSLDGRGDTRAMRDELQAKAKGSRECRIAAGDGMKPVALHSVVTVIPGPAG